MVIKEQERYERYSGITSAMWGTGGLSEWPVRLGLHLNNGLSCRKSQRLACFQKCRIASIVSLQFASGVSYARRAATRYSTYSRWIRQWISQTVDHGH